MARQTAVRNAEEQGQPVPELSPSYDVAATQVRCGNPAAHC